MILLNEDYSAIKSQMKSIRKYLMQYFSSFQIFDGIETHDALEENINVPKEKQYVFASCDMEMYEEEKLVITQKLASDFQKELSFHQDFLTSSCHILSQFQEEVEDDISYVSNKDYTTLLDEEELLDNFFQEEGMELKDIYNDMVKQKQIYSVTKAHTPSAIYNNLQAIPNIFIPKQRSTITKLCDVIHELGHIYDETNLYEKDPANLFPYSYSSLYKEVFSYYYEQKFLYFLIANDIYKMEAQNELLDILSTLVVDLRTTGNMFRFSHYDSYCLHSDIQYSYGPIISNFIMDSSFAKDKFQTFRHESFSSSKLEMIGVVKENAANAMVKKIKPYFTM